MSKHNHTSQLFSKKVSIFLKNLEVYCFIGIQNYSQYYMNGYIFTMIFETDLGILLNADNIHKDQCSKNLVSQPLPLQQSVWFFASWISLGHTLLAGPQLTSPVGTPETSAQRNSSALLMFLIWWCRIPGLLSHRCAEGKKVITAATASMAQLPTHFRMLSESNILIMSKTGLDHQSWKELPLKGSHLLP